MSRLAILLKSITRRSSSNFMSQRWLHRNVACLGPVQERIERKLNDTLKPRSRLFSSTSEAPTTANTGRHKISVLGGGSWGTTVADLIAHNVVLHPEVFHPDVILFFRNANLAETVAERRENPTYLPTVKLSSNLHPTGSLEEALASSDILIFAIPNAYVVEVCQRVGEVFKSYPHPPASFGISLTKGVNFDPAGQLEMISTVYQRMVGVPVGALSGANIAMEVAKRQYCDAVLCPPTLESMSKGEMIRLLLAMFEADHFKVRFRQDMKTVELCGALKNVIACGAGLIDGLGYGMNTKAAAIACGLREVRRFIATFHPDYAEETLFDSCGVADIVVSSFAGRNLRVAKAFAAQSQLENGEVDLERLEVEVLRGQKLQGPGTARHVYQMLANERKLAQFPFFKAVHQIFNEGPTYLTLKNESGMHNVPKGSESHFRLLIVSGHFDRLNTLQRHRLINEVLREDFALIHALTVEAYTPKQWETMSEASDLVSPTCRGGSKL